MAKLTSHVLDAVDGVHASGIRIELVEILGDVRNKVFDINANDEGRID